MPVSASKRNANNKWDKENMKIVACKLRKEYAVKFSEKAAANGTTPNALLRGFVYDYIGVTDKDS